MTIPTRLLLFALPLALDTFALSTVLGVLPLPRSARLRAALIFAGAEVLMPVVGILLGVPLGRAIGDGGEYLAGGLLCALGLWLWRQQRHEERHERKGQPQTEQAGEQGESAAILRAAVRGGWPLVALALSISLDELAVGLSFGLLGIPLLLALSVIGVQALVASLLGQWVGRRAGERLGEWAERLAGPLFVLMGLGFIVARVFRLPL